jgi:hypothetical protein
MLYITAQSKGSYASAYMQEAVWRKNNHIDELVYARIAGKPTLVKAIAAILMRGEYVRAVHEEKTKWLYGIKHSKCLYHKIDKIAVATYYCKDLLNPHSNTTILIGKDQQLIQNAFKSILRKKPILLHEKWDTSKIFSELDLLTKLDSYEISGYEIIWNTERINEHISNLVKDKKLIF